METLPLGTIIAKVQELRASIQASIFGQEPLIEETLACFLANGHILMTGAPGLAKTTLVRVFASHLHLQYSRVQFTPDLLPSDILGSEVLNIDQATGKKSFEFIPGPVFTNLLLADEINRASPRTQSALLEAMQERNVTTGGQSRGLPLPFMVFATQNPFESEGTFPLPEAQLDRFLVHSLVDYPDQPAEERILREYASGALIGERFARREDSSGAKTPGPNMQHSDVHALQETVRRLPVDESIFAGVNAFVRMTRPQDESCSEHIKSMLVFGAGPRAGISLLALARAYAAMSGDEVVQWRHIRRFAKPALRHRLRVSGRALRDGFTTDHIIDLVLQQFEEQHKHKVVGG